MTTTRVGCHRLSSPRGPGLVRCVCWWVHTRPQPVESLTAVTPRGTAIGRTPSGALLIPGGVDYVEWTEQVEGFAGRVDR